MKQYKEMMDFIQECRRLCPWTSKQTLQSYKKQLMDETKEVIQAIDKRDYQNLKEELGDVIWDAMMMAHIAEKKGYFKADDVITSVTKKIKRRKPYIIEGRRVTLKEAWDTWYAVKAKEKRAKKK